MSRSSHIRGADAGPSQRQLRVAELIRRSLSDVLARGDLFDPDLAGKSITVSEVRTSPDLKIATVYVLPLGGLDTETVIAALNNNKRELRHILTKQVRLKYSPQLRFIADESFDRMDETRRLFESEAVARDLKEADED